MKKAFKQNGSWMLEKSIFPSSELSDLTLHFNSNFVIPAMANFFTVAFLAHLALGAAHWPQFLSPCYLQGNAVPLRVSPSDPLCPNPECVPPSKWSASCGFRPHTCSIQELDRQEGSLGGACSGQEGQGRTGEQADSCSPFPPPS